MANQVDEITVRFKTEGGETVEEAFKRNANAADRYHQQITKTGGALGELRLKAEARVANNIGAIAQAMTGGASAGEIFATAITKVSESFRGSLLFAGAATVGFALYQGITKAGEAVIALETKLSDLKRSTSVSGDFIGADQVSKNLDAATASLDELRAKYVKEHTGLGGQFDLAVRGLLTGSTGGELESQDAINVSKARQSILGALSQTADKQKTLNEITREGLVGDERKAVLAKVEADHKERAAKIAGAEAKVGFLGTSGAQRAETDRVKLEEAVALKPSILREVGLETQREIVNIEKQLLPQAEENLAILDARIDAIKELLSGTTKLNDTEREEYQNQLGQLEATKARAQFARQLETDLAGLELGRTRGEVGSNRAAILERQRLADQAAAQNSNSPESQRAQAGLENEQFAQFQEYEKNPGAFRQKRINEQHERGRFQYLRATGQLPDDIESGGSDIRTPDQRKAAAAAGAGGSLPQKIERLIQTLLALPQKIGVG